MKVSVIVPAYNAAPFLEEAVESIFATRYSRLEVLIVDDGSKDDTLQKAWDLKQRYAKNINVLRHPGGRNRGAGATRNRGIKAASGDVIAFLDADDEYLPNRFETCVQILADEPNVDAVFEKTKVVVEENGDAVRDWAPDGVIELKCPTGVDFLKALLTGYGEWHTNAITIRRKVFSEVGYFNTKMKVAQDTEFWMRLLVACNLRPGAGRIPVALYRRHDGNRSFPDQYNTSIVTSLGHAIRAARKMETSTEKLAMLEDFFRRRTKERLGWLIENDQLREALFVIRWMIKVNPRSIANRFLLGNVRNMIANYLAHKV